MDQGATSQDAAPPPQPLVVGTITHHSIELGWDSGEGERSGPAENWTAYTLEQMDFFKQAFNAIYVGYSTQFIVEDLQPNTEYRFRLKTGAEEECCIGPVLSVWTKKERLCGIHLHEAVNKNDDSEVSKVLESGIMNVNVCDSLGYTPLMVAVQKGFDRIARKLVDHDADIHVKNSSGKDCLMLACFAGNLEIVKYLRSLGANWRSRDRVGCTPLHCAVDGGHLPVIEYLIENGFKVDVRETLSQWTPLMRVSAVTGNTSVASMLIKHGADINVRDGEGKTPLMLAVLNNHLELVELLLESGADQQVQNKFGSDAVDMAKSFGKQNMINLLKGKRNL